MKKKNKEGISIHHRSVGQKSHAVTGMRLLILQQLDSPACKYSGAPKCAGNKSQAGSDNSSGSVGRLQRVELAHGDLRLCLSCHFCFISEPRPMNHTFQVNKPLLSLFAGWFINLLLRQMILCITLSFHICTATNRSQTGGGQRGVS